MTAAVWSYAGLGDDTGKGTDGTTGHAKDVAATASVTVFNVEPTCRARAAERPQQCSLGLAVNPLAPYTIDNVVPTRVWHGDVLTAECRTLQGLPVTDEEGARTTEWYRVRLPEGAGQTRAWLPAVRTKDRPALSECR
ncbi:hypothetical protein ABZ896_44300 [Streptomyces sp. NPDC047072]|uniref:hypothetical protein n=1 Tax=Streptomyces sp. NPDC047072 TaxID=3154809 RepID=UPI0034052299